MCRLNSGKKALNYYINLVFFLSQGCCFFYFLLGSIPLLNASLTGHMIMFTSIVPNEVDSFLPPEMPLVILSYRCLPEVWVFLTSDLSLRSLVG